MVMVSDGKTYQWVSSPGLKLKIGQVRVGRDGSVELPRPFLAKTPPTSKRAKKVLLYIWEQYLFYSIIHHVWKYHGSKDTTWWQTDGRADSEVLVTEFRFYPLGKKPCKLARQEDQENGSVFPQMCFVSECVCVYVCWSVQCGGIPRLQLNTNCKRNMKLYHKVGPKTSFYIPTC